MEETDRKSNIKFLGFGLLMGIIIAAVVFIVFSATTNHPDYSDFQTISLPENPAITYSPLNEAEKPQEIFVKNTTYEQIGEAVWLNGRITNNGTRNFSSLEIVFYAFNSTGAFLGETSTTIEDLGPGEESQFIIIYPNSEAKILQLATIKEN